MREIWGNRILLWNSIENVNNEAKLALKHTLDVIPHLNDAHSLKDKKSDLVENFFPLTDKEKVELLQNILQNLTKNDAYRNIPRSRMLEAISGFSSQYLCLDSQNCDQIKEGVLLANKHIDPLVIDLSEFIVAEIVKNDKKLIDYEYNYDNIVIMFVYSMLIQIHAKQQSMHELSEKGTKLSENIYKAFFQKNFNQINDVKIFKSVQSLEFMDTLLKLKAVHKYCEQFSNKIFFSAESEHIVDVICQWIDDVLTHCKENYQKSVCFDFMTLMSQMRNSKSFKHIEKKIEHLAQKHSASKQSL